jgi:hypothetical protein
MPKIPKLSELASNMPGMFDKFKTMIDSLTGPSQTNAVEEALAKETDPFKAKLLEVEVLINQLSDIASLQSRTFNNLKTSYAELQKTVITMQEQANAEPVAAAPTTESATTAASDDNSPKANP